MRGIKVPPFIVLLAILAGSAALMWRASADESAIMDELAHIPAGYGYVRYLDYRLNPEHPPLVKALAALPLLAFDLDFPADRPSWTTDANGQWETGRQFLYESGNDADLILRWVRLFPTILTLVAVVLIYIWSKELLGGWWALLPAFLFAFSPAVLAHGHYVTTDLGAALGALLAIFAFVKYLLKPAGWNLLWSGLALGAAELMKFSNALLIPFFILLAAVFLIAKKIRTPAEPLRFWRRVKNLILIFIIALALIYAVYFLFAINYPPEKNLTDTVALLHTFAPRWLADFDITLIKNSILRPLGQYFLGLLMVLERSAFGNTGYFLGEVSNTGWWYYFPVVFLIKEPLPSLILLFAALAFSLKNLKIKNWKLKIFSEWLGLHLPEFAMLAFVLLYWIWSVKSPLNIGVRHLLPTLPFLYILAASALKNSIPFKKIILFAVAAWYLAETAIAWPYFLPYFNEFAGGSQNGYRYVADSNYDWGQDLKKLKSFIGTWNMEHDDKIEKIAVDYFGGGDLKYYLGDIAKPWQSARGTPANENIEWLAISVNNLQGAWGRLNADGGLQRRPEDEYRWLKNIPLSGRAGRSIFIYRLPLPD